MTIPEACEYFKANERNLRRYAHYHWNKRLASNACAASWTADDVYQETLTRVLENLHQFKGGNFGNWVGVIMTNLACSLINKHLRMDKLHHEVERMPKDSTEEVLEREQLSTKLYEEIEHLSPHRGISLLYLLEPTHRHGDGQEVANELGIPLNSLKQFKFQAVASLRKKLVK